MHFPCFLPPVGLVNGPGISTPPGSAIVGFMLLAMDRIGTGLQNPSENRAHDVPVTSITRTIQIDPEQRRGECAAPVRPVENVLW